MEEETLPDKTNYLQSPPVQKEASCNRTLEEESFLMI